MKKVVKVLKSNKSVLAWFIRVLKSNRSVLAWFYLLLRIFIKGK